MYHKALYLIALFSSSLRRGIKPCAFWDYLNLFPELFGFLLSPPVWVRRFFIELVGSDFHQPTSPVFGFPLSSPAWVGKFYIELIVRFSSPVFRQDWEVFYQTYLGSFDFPFQYFTKLENFFINQSRIFLIVPMGLRILYLGIWFFLFIFLFVGKRFFYPFYKSNTKWCWWNLCSTKLVPKKENNCNIVATWPITWPCSLSYPTIFHKFHQLYLPITLFLTVHLSNTPAYYSTTVSNSYLLIFCLLELDLLYLDHSTEPCNWQKLIEQN